MLDQNHFDGQTRTYGLLLVQRRLPGAFVSRDKKKMGQNEKETTTKGACKYAGWRIDGNSSEGVYTRSTYKLLPITGSTASPVPIKI